MTTLSSQTGTAVSPECYEAVPPAIPEQEPDTLGSRVLDALARNIVSYGMIRAGLLVYDAFRRSGKHVGTTETEPTRD